MVNWNEKWGICWKAGVMVFETCSKLSNTMTFGFARMRWVVASLSVWVDEWCSVVVT